MNTPAPDDRLIAQLSRVRSLAFGGNVPDGLALFHRVAKPVNCATCDIAMLRQLVWAALAVGDTAFISAALNKRFDKTPPIEVVVEKPSVWPRGRQAVHCYASASGLRFVLASTAIDGRGLNLLAGRLVRTMPMFVECYRSGLGREGKVILNIADAARFPGVGYCANTSEIGLIPDPDFMASRGYADFLAHLEKNPVPWAERKQVAYWRGATTGHGDGTEPRWESLQRVHLCKAVQGPHADLFNAGISRVQLAPGDPGIEEIPLRGYMKPYESSLDLHKYRYQIDIDGYTSAWSALFTKLATGSAVLKVASRDGWRQWYYDRLVPWENYVPVAADMSDLVEKTRWLIDHDDEAQRIGAAGRALALSMTYESQVHAGAEEIASWMRKSLEPGAKRKKGAAA
jgi:hypothetical protein